MLSLVDSQIIYRQISINAADHSNMSCGVVGHKTRGKTRGQQKTVLYLFSKTTNEIQSQCLSQSMVVLATIKYWRGITGLDYSKTTFCFLTCRSFVSLSFFFFFFNEI